jgi:hypothetical protein
MNQGGKGGGVSISSRLWDASDFETILCPDCLDARYKQASKGEKVPCPDWLNNDVLQRKLKGGRFIPETNATQGDLFS